MKGAGNMTWSVLIADGLAQNGKNILEESMEVHDRTGITKEELQQKIPSYDALIVRSRTKVTPELLREAKKLRVIGRAGVGVDNISLKDAKSLGISVVNAPAASSRAVAELTLGLMFSLARMIPKADHDMKSGEWTKKALRGTELSGKNLGIVGVGHIGSIVAELAHAVGMEKFGYDPLISQSEIQQRGAHPVDSVDVLYAQSDYITLHIPLTDKTRNLVDSKTLQKMKPGVKLICTARGGVIVEADLLEALDSGHVAGAALDVFAQEPPGLTELVAHPNFIATPHIGAQTVEAQSRVAEDIASEVLNALQGKPLRWQVV